MVIIIVCKRICHKFQYTSEHSNADALSRIPLREIPAHTETPAELVLLMEPGPPTELWGAGALIIRNEALDHTCGDYCVMH